MFNAVKTKGGRTEQIVDHNHLTCKHHIYMSISTLSVDAQNKSRNVLLIGVGGGSLCTFLNSLLPNCNIVGVDIDEDIVNISCSWFGLTQNDKLKLVIKDGIEFLKTARETGR